MSRKFLSFERSSIYCDIYYEIVFADLRSQIDNDKTYADLRSHAALRLCVSTRMLKVFYFVCSFPDTQKYSSSNWTVLALPTLTPVNTALYTRHLRSMTFKGDQDKMRRYGPRKYLCTDCNRKFALMASLKRHRTFECNKRTAMSEKNVREKLSEQERRRKKKHTCPNCNRSYKLFTSLWRHQNYECGVEPKFSCPICKNRFSQKANLERHVRTKH